jgi:predicted transcriptional regulator
MKHYFLYFVSMPVTKKPVKKGKKKVASPEGLKKLGERIKSLRIKNGYTNYENFAFENDIPRAQFGRYERGEDLRYSSLIKIIKAFRISVKEFFSEGFD